MASYNKFNGFTQDIINGVYNFTSDTFKVMLTNTAPTATNHLYGDISGSELANGNGYTTGGTTSAMTVSTSSGTAKVVAAVVVFTATGSMGPFRYTVLYDTTPSSPLKPLVGWWDYGSSITLASSETFTVGFDQTNGIFQIT